jgi:predicted Zn finger-like uncharacterized protein
MTNQRLTQCPHCKASFKVSEDQLSAANGRVRCGACMNIFDAIAYSISKINAAKNKDTTGTDSSETDLEEPTPSIQDDTNLFADNPEEDQEDASYSGSAQLGDEFSTSFLDLDKDASSSADPYSTSFQNMDSETFDANEPNEAIDESWAQNILDDITPKPNDKIEPHIPPPPAKKEHSSSAGFDAIMTDPSEHLPGEAITQSKNDQHQNQFEKINFQYQQDSDPKQRHWLTNILFGLANLSLALLLLVQASWFHYEKLAKYPQLASLYQLACKQFSCTLPKLEDINKIKNNNLVVRSHPTARKSLIIDTVIENDAGFEQNFPSIALYFSDINKKIIAQRLIKPNEYRTGEILSWKKMPSKQPIHISLEIIDPGKEAVNYTLKFFPSSESEFKPQNKT